MNIVDMFRLDGKTSIVTGCSAGLGVSLASGLAEAGSNLVVCARREEKLRANAEAIASKTGRSVLPVVADVSNESEVERLFSEAAREFGSVDVLVNNAGVTLAKPAEELSGEEWHSINRTNLDGVFYCSREACRLMMKTKTRGSIVNLASIYGFSADVLFPIVAYHASKAAVINMTKALAVEWSKYGIRVNGIAPSFIHSEMCDLTLSDPKRADYIIRHTPLGRVGEPAELNGALLLLASEAGRYITGTTICVDGGWTAV